MQTAQSQSALSQEQIQLGRDVFGQSQQELQRSHTLQQPLIDFYQGILDAGKTGDYSSIISAGGVPLKQTAQGAETAKANIMNSVPEGAGRDYALANLERGKQDSISSIINQIYMGAAPALANIGSGAAQVGLQELGGSISSLGGASSSLSGASSSYGNIANQQAQGKATTMGFLGNLAGAAGTAFGGKPCWIAEAIYGVDDPRTHAARAWLIGPFSDVWYGRLVVQIYCVFGKHVAAVVRRSRILKATFKPLFDMAATRGRELVAMARPKT